MCFFHACVTFSHLHPTTKSWKQFIYTFSLEGVERHFGKCKKSSQKQERTRKHSNSNVFCLFWLHLNDFGCFYIYLLKGRKLLCGHLCRYKHDFVTSHNLEANGGTIMVVHIHWKWTFQWSKRHLVSRS